MAGKENAEGREYVDMMARPEMVRVEVGERSLTMSREEAKAVGRLIYGYLKLRWQADPDGYPSLVAPGKVAGAAPTQPLPRGLYQRPLGVDQPAEGDRLPADHDGALDGDDL